MQFRHVLLILSLFCAIQITSAQSPAWQKTTKNELISSIDLSSDGSVIAAGSTMGTLTVFDKTGRMQWNITVPGALLVDVSPDGSLIFSGSRESMEKDKGTVRAYDRTGKEAWLNNTGWISQLHVAGDPLRVAVGTRRGTAEVYDAKGKLVKMYSSFPLLDVVKELGISADGKSIAFSLFSRNPAFKFANVSKGSVTSPALFGDHIAISANGSALAVADGEGSSGDLYLYAANGTRLWNLNTGNVNDLAISANAACVLTGEEDGTITCYNRTGNVSWTYQAEGAVTSLSITPNATLVAAGSSDEHIYLLDGNGKLLWEYDDDEALENPISMVRVSGDGSTVIAVAGGTDLIYFPIEKGIGTPEPMEITTPPVGNTTVNATQPKGNTTLNATKPLGNSTANATQPKGNTTVNATKPLGNSTVNTTMNASQLKGLASGTPAPAKGNATPAGKNTTSAKTNTTGNMTIRWNDTYFSMLRYPGTGHLPWLAAWEQFMHSFARG